MFLYIYYIKTWTLSQGTAGYIGVHVVLREHVRALEWLEGSFLEYAWAFSWILWGKCVKETYFVLLVDGEMWDLFIVFVFAWVYSDRLGLAKEPIPALASREDYREAWAYEDQAL